MNCRRCTYLGAYVYMMNLIIVIYIQKNGLSF